MKWTAISLVAAFLLAFAGSAAAGYKDLGDGSVLDTATGLAWESASGTQTYTWQAALARCESLTTGGHGDWRLPNIRELASLIDYSRHMPAVDPRFAVSAAYMAYWSSSAYLGWGSTAAIINTYYGTLNGASKTPIDPESPYAYLMVRCVRDGDEGPSAMPFRDLLLLGE
jgi:hypothetical protein